MKMNKMRNAIWALFGAVIMYLSLGMYSTYRAIVKSDSVKNVWKAAPPLIKIWSFLKNSVKLLYYIYNA